MGRKRQGHKRINETSLERSSRLARERDMAAQRSQPLVTAEAAAHGDYEESWTEVDGRRARVLINRGGSTIQRWLNAPHDEQFGDSEKAAVRYCMSLWAKLDAKGPRTVIVDGGRPGESEHEALAELAALKVRVPSKYWSIFENVCRWEQASPARHTKVTVAFVAGMIALWRGL